MQPNSGIAGGLGGKQPGGTSQPFPAPNKTNITLSVPGHPPSSQGGAGELHVPVKDGALAPAARDLGAVPD